MEDALARGDRALAIGLPNPITLRSAYVDALAMAEFGCPRRENVEDVGFTGVWFDDCTTAGGAHFDGQGDFEEAMVAGDWTFEGVANFTVTDPGGDVFSGGGEFALWGETDDSGGKAWTSKTGGVFSLDTGEGWLGEAGRAGFFVGGVVDGVQAVIGLDGGVGYNDVDIAFEGLVSDASACDGMPTGGYLVRDSTGFWFSAALTGCDGCGPVTWRDLEMGESCPGAAIQGAIEALVAGQQWL